MAYIGRDIDKISNVEVLDNITFDGSSSYTLQKGGSNFTPSSANTLLVSIDGVVQAGNFTVSGSTINFGTAVSASSTCNFILHYGVGLITTPADGTVTNDKINYPLAKSGAVVSSFKRTTSDGDIIKFYKDTTNVGSIGAHNTRITIGNEDTGLKFNSGIDSIFPFDLSIEANRDNAVDLGFSTARFRDIYLGGGVYVGGTGTANKLDDYEEGTWTPTISGGFNAGVTYAVQGGTYTKIGNRLFFSCRLEIGTGTGNANRLDIGGLPFTSATSPSGSFAGGAYFIYVNANIINSTTTNSPAIYIPQNASYMSFYKTNGIDFAGTDLSVPTNADFYLNGTYITN